MANELTLIATKRLERLEETTATATDPENRNYSPEAWGLARGMALALSIINNDRNPPTWDRPRKWGADKKPRKYG